MTRDEALRYRRTFNASFTEAVQRDTSGTGSAGLMGKSYDTDGWSRECL